MQLWKHMCKSKVTLLTNKIFCLLHDVSYAIKTLKSNPIFKVVNVCNSCRIKYIH